ncbi:hypothetical protein KP79_PYT03510 [Mizuhopecten yessoensis]|uniref:Uncharacterized protein n=1 Tax=Mizuhopecten yessoensis TaxID=6573 RepID=A0A210PD83_MIZYE|nr:hypothetical protein KP79_PYT03510 [Mizuhopecten yessoensis]
MAMGIMKKSTFSAPRRLSFFRGPSETSNIGSEYSDPDIHVPSKVHQLTKEQITGRHPHKTDYNRLTPSLILIITGRNLPLY